MYLIVTNPIYEDILDFRKDAQYREIFFASYQAFTNAEDVFNLLIERFKALSSPAHAGTKLR
jgi:son of sevenless-like protein